MQMILTWIEVTVTSPFSHWNQCKLVRVCMCRRHLSCILLLIMPKYPLGQGLYVAETVGRHIGHHDPWPWTFEISGHVLHVFQWKLILAVFQWRNLYQAIFGWGMVILNEAFPAIPAIWPWPHFQGHSSRVRNFSVQLERWLDLYTWKIDL